MIGPGEEPSMVISRSEECISREENPKARNLKRLNPKKRYEVAAQYFHPFDPLSKSLTLSIMPSNTLGVTMSKYYMLLL